ncbi:PREDICTED: neuritin [Pygoscelis adeliae]|uniref:neuritin n=1 Tax=Pygoscelis adeliae TaxID=9238 RepID=UPI0004F4FC6A|nr:PREDICTED: neuritin [Pygoscelis adeliae]
MGLKLNGRYISLILAVQIGINTQGQQRPNMMSFGPGVPDQRWSRPVKSTSFPSKTLFPITSHHPIAFALCRDVYWDDFHACTLTALTDCQEGARDLWEKLRRESKNLDFQGSLFELCGGGSGAAPSLLPPALPLLLAALWAALVTWLPF